jgi:hypothetical protein
MGGSPTILSQFDFDWQKITGEANQLVGAVPSKMGVPIRVAARSFRIASPERLPKWEVFI